MRTFPVIIIAMLVLTTACEIMPRNSLKDCREQCKDSKKSRACYDFCDCIHESGQPLDTCLDKYDKAPADSVRGSK